MHYDVSDAPLGLVDCCCYVHVDAVSCMVEGEINHIKVVIGSVTAEVFSWYVLQSKGELMTVIATLGESDGHGIGPIINEEQSSSEVDGIMSSCGEGWIVEG